MPAARESSVLPQLCVLLLLGCGGSEPTVPGVATRLVPLGDNRTGAAGEYLTTIATVHAPGGVMQHPVGSIAARPMDAFGNATALMEDDTGTPTLRVPVTFTITSGGGCLKGTLSLYDCVQVATSEPGNLTYVTDTAYQFAAGVDWRLGDIPGSNTVVATAPGLPPLTFTATGQ